MLKFADLSYFQHRVYDSLQAVLNGVGLSLTYLNYLKRDADIVVIQHGVTRDAFTTDGIRYAGFPGSKSFFHNPTAAHKELKQFRPDVVLVQGLIFPVQVWLLRRVLGSGVVILVQHHGEQPFINKLKRFCQRLADKSIDGYLFTSKGNAKRFVEAGMISSLDRCYEVLECSTELRPANKEESKAKLGFTGAFNFLWVGRLNKGKDPLTVLNGFERFLSEQPNARLYMIYQTEELLDAVEMKLASNEDLKEAVVLVGKLPHHQLAVWYSAADFLISGSHHEAAGFALIEAMACGCIPVVTNIPSFTQLTGDGKYAPLFEAGNAASLHRALRTLNGVERAELTTSIRQHFETELSFKKISDDILRIATELLRNKR